MLGNEWRKSTFSDPQGQACVEARKVDGGVELRDTKDRSKPAHFYTDPEWDAFIAGAKAGEFDNSAV